MQRLSELRKALLSRQDEGSTYETLKGIYSFCEAEGGEAAIIPGTLDRLIHFMQRKYSLGIQSLSCAILCSLCKDVDLRCVLIGKGVMGPLMEILRHPLTDDEKDYDDDDDNEGEEALKMTLLEQGTMLLCKLCCDIQTTQQSQQISQHLPLIMDLCTPERSYLFRDSPRTTQVIRKLLYKKQLVGEMRPLAAAKVEREYKSYVGFDAPAVAMGMADKAYEIELYDTTDPDLDVCIREALLAEKLVWPANNNDCQKDIAECGGGDSEKNVEPEWTDVHVTHVVSTCYFWAHLGAVATETARTIRETLNDWPESERNMLKKPPRVGDFVCAYSPRDNVGHYRAQVIGVSENRPEVLALDYGFKAAVQWEDLFYLSAKMGLGGIPPQAVFCAIPGIVGIPCSILTLENLLGALSNLCQNDFNIGEKLIAGNALSMLLSYSQSPILGVAERAINTISGIVCSHRQLRECVGKMGAIEILLDHCQRYCEETDGAKQRILLFSLAALNNILYENQENKDKFIDLQGLSVLIQLQSRSVVEAVVEGALKVLRAFIGSADGLHEDTLSGVDPAAMPARPSHRNEGDLYAPPRGRAPATNHRMQRTSRSHSTGRSQSGSRSLSRGRDKSRDRHAAATRSVKLHQDESSDDDGPGGASGNDGDGGLYLLADSERARGSGTVLAVHAGDIAVEEDQYVRGYGVAFKSDATHALLHTPHIDRIPKASLCKLGCSFLNSLEGGSIFLGINTDNEVFGIGVNRSKRDMLRVALDRCMMDLVPSVMHSLYELIYFTVVGPEGIEKNMTGIPLPDRFVIEIRFKSGMGTMYSTADKSCYVRQGSRTVEASMQDVRNLVVRDEEIRFRSEIETLTAEIDRYQSQSTQHPGS